MRLNIKKTKTATTVAKITVNTNPGLESYSTWDLISSKNMAVEATKITIFKKANITVTKSGR